MNIRIAQTVVIFGALVLIGGCNSSPDVSKFITKEGFTQTDKACTMSSDDLCAIRPSFQKVEEHCSKNSVLENECQLIKDDVIRKAIQFRKEDAEATKRITEQIKRSTP